MVFVRSYFGTENLGDAMQTFALCRLLPSVAVWPGEEMAAQAPLVINGWLGRSPVYGPKTIYAGVFVSSHMPAQYAAIERCVNPPIGARDPVTASNLARRSVSAELIGCSTLTLPRFNGARTGILHVDDDTPNCLTNWIPPETSWFDQWQMTIERIEALKHARLVYTQRLHIVLPCLALGTPVAWRRNGDEANERFSLLDCMNVPEGVEVESFDVSAWAARYRRFLSAKLRITLVDRDPPFPS